MNLQIGDHRATVEADAKESLTLIAGALAAEIGRRSGDDLPVEALFAEALSTEATAKGRQVALIEADRIVTTSPFRPDLAGEPPTALLGANQPLTTFGRRAGVMEITERGVTFYATVHHVEGADAMIALTQPVHLVLSAWREELARVFREVSAPAMARWRDTIREVVVPAARPDERPGICHLPDGEDSYARSLRKYTSTGLSAEELAPGRDVD